MRPRRLLALAVLLAAALSVAGPAAAQTPLALGPVVDIAHRGASFDAPEHTMAAHDKALLDGSEFVECDLQFTSDRVLVCIHDTTLDRTARTADGMPVTGRVDAYTLAQLRTFDFGLWFNQARPTRARPEYVGQRVLTLEEELDRYSCVNPRVRFHIETKAPSEYGGDMERELIRVLATRNLLATGDAQTGRVIVQSFNPDSLLLVEAMQPQLPTAFLQLTPTPVADPIDIAAPNSAGLLAIRTTGAAFIASEHAKGHEVHTYTVDDPAQLNALLDLGIDGIFTNRPDVLRALIDARGTGVPTALRGTPTAATFPTGCPGGPLSSGAAVPPAVVPEAPAGALPALAVALLGLGLLAVRRTGRPHGAPGA